MVLFVIEKNYDVEHKPFKHPKLRKETIYKVHERTVDHPSKLRYDQKTAKTWYDVGENHRVKGGHIMRDERIEAWVMDCEVEDILQMGNWFGEIKIQTWIDEYTDLEGYDLPVIQIER